MTSIASPWISRRHLLAGAGSLALAASAPRLVVPARAETAGTPKRGGVINLLVDPEPPVLVPAINSSGPGRALGPKTNEGLLDYDFDLTPRPQLATSWSVAPDGLQYTFNLRPGVKWHDGKDFTSADVAFSILFLKQNHPNGRSTFANVSEVRTPDPLTAVIVLSKPAPYLITAFAAQESPIIAKHAYEGEDPLTAAANNRPIGTGPYIFKEWVKGSHIIYERNPNYWDQPKPYIDRLVVRFIPDAAARAAALESGAVDLAGETPVPLSDLERFKALPHITLETNGYNYNNDLNQLVFNLDNPFLGKLEVRQALAHAIDKQVVLDLIWYGYGVVARGPVHPTFKAFYADDLPVYEFDTKKAEALLDKAGYPRGSDGIRFKLTNDFLPYGENFRRGSEYIRQALGKIGIDLTIRAQDFPTYIRRVYTQREFDFANAWLGNSFDPSVGAQRLFWSKNFKLGVPFSNGAHYANPEADRLLEAAAVEVNLEARARYFKDFQHLVVRDLPHLDLVAQKFVTLAHRKVKNHTVSASGLRASLADVWVDA